MDRICDPRTDGSVPFFQYRWAYFFADAFANENLWGDSDALKQFTAQYGSLPAAGSGGADTGAWQIASDNPLVCYHNIDAA
jgi:hypothetical protein